MFITALFTIARLWKQPRCPTTEEWIKKLWYIYTMEFYSTIKNNDIWFEGKWLQLEDIMLNEVSQDQKNKNHMFSLMLYFLMLVLNRTLLLACISKC
jgi:hypothetical protein